jgi:hypothetical protein
MEDFWRIVGASHKTGNTQLAVFDLEAQRLLVSYSHNLSNGTLYAYARNPILVELGPLWERF